jgi:hypothetical protein
MESITGIINAKVSRDVMVADVPNVFVQTEIDEKKKRERIAIEIRGALVNMLVEIDCKKYEEFVINCPKQGKILSSS